MSLDPTVRIGSFLGESFPIKRYPDGSIGRYLCRCVHCATQFIGHKRDVVCYLCVRPPAPGDNDKAREGKM